MRCRAHKQSSVGGRAPVAIVTNPMDHSSCPLLSLKNELLLNAVVRGDLPTAKRLIDRHGAQVNSENSSGMSTLQLAIVNQHSKLAEYLIQKGVDIHKADSRGWTALHDAALVDNTVIVKKLISKGVSPMRTTNQSELVIDVAGSQQMELILCEEMCNAGEVDLARQYYKYLSLNMIGNGGNAHNSFSKGNRGNLYAPPTSAKSSQTCGSKSALYSRSSTTCSIGASTSGLCKLPNACVGSAMTLRHHPNSNHKEQPVSLGNTTDSGGRTNAAKCSVQYKTSQPASETVEVQTTEQSVVTDTTYESTQVNYSKPREDVAINSLYLHSGFQLQIGLSLLSRESQSSSLDTDTVAECPDRSNKRVAGSPPVRHHRKATRTQSDPATKNPLQAQFQNPRPGKKVSFSELPMTRTKLPSVDLPVKTRPDTIMEDRVSPTGSRAVFTLSSDMLQHLTDIHNHRDENKTSSSDEELGDAGIRALRKKPRKSSIVSPQRRRSSTERRRSVTFQPEVLLHENVISGDAKAVSDMLEAGMVRDVNKMSPAGLTALHQSAIDGNLACAKALICNGANVNCTDCELWTPLHAAAVTGQVEFVRYLLLSGADPNLKNDNGETPYDITKNAQVRKMLLHSMNGKSPDSNEFSDAEYSGEEEAEEYSHAESDSEDEAGSSELFMSNKDQETSLKERLGLKHSAALKNSQDPSVSPSPDLDTADSVFMTENKSLKPRSILRPERDLNDSTSSYSSVEPDLEQLGKESGYQASSDGERVSEDQGICTMDGSSDCSHRSRTLSEDEGTTRDVLDSELVPGSLDYRFQEACLDCDIDSVLKLVKHKADIDVNRVNVNSGVTALHHAVLEENYALVQHLIVDFESDLHIQDRDGWTPLHAASAVGNLRIAQLLLDHGAKASVLNSQCEFPVDVAIDEAMEKLLKNIMLGPGVGTLFQGVLTR